MFSELKGLNNEYPVYTYMVYKVRYKVVGGVLEEDRRAYSDISPLAATKTNVPQYCIQIRDI